MYFSEYWHNHPKYPGALWVYDYRNFFCYKHERMYEQERAMWDKHLPGHNAPHTWQHRRERRKYRAQVKNLMRHERYDDIVDKKKDWH